MKKKRWTIIITLNNNINMESLIEGDVFNKQKVIEDVRATQEEIIDLVNKVNIPSETIQFIFPLHKRLFIFAIPREHVLHIEVEPFKKNDDFKHLSKEGEKIINES